MCEKCNCQKTEAELLQEVKRLELEVRIKRLKDELRFPPQPELWSLSKVSDTSF